VSPEPRGANCNGTRRGTPPSPPFSQGTRSPTRPWRPGGTGGTGSACCSGSRGKCCVLEGSKPGVTRGCPRTTRPRPSRRLGPHIVAAEADRDGLPDTRPRQRSMLLTPHSITMSYEVYFTPPIAFQGQSNPIY
jgi:hypothetical protein